MSTIWVPARLNNLSRVGGTLDLGLSSLVPTNELCTYHRYSRDRMENMERHLFISYLSNRATHRPTDHRLYGTASENLQI